MGRCFGAGGAGNENDDGHGDMTTLLVDGNQMILILEFFHRRIEGELSQVSYDFPCNFLVHLGDFKSVLSSSLLTVRHISSPVIVPFFL